MVCNFFKAKAFMNSETITIPNRFRGPPASGNGGYVCGAIGALLGVLPGDHAAQVRLRSPVPLDIPLEVKHAKDLTTVHHGETLIAEAVPGPLTLDVPAAPDYAQALALRAHSPALMKSINSRFAGRIGPHPVCFCCGAEHGDGLEVYAAPVPDRDMVAAAWATQRSWADANGFLPAPFVWTALDCPGQFAFYAAGIRTGMLGRLCARIERPIAAGERCVVIGWRIGVEGRRHYAGTAVLDEDGRLCAYAKAVWIGRREG
jgi:hypothetical protein